MQWQRIASSQEQPADADVPANRVEFAYRASGRKTEIDRKMKIEAAMLALSLIGGG